MLRALVVSFAMLAANPGLCYAGDTVQAVADQTNYANEASNNSNPIEVSGEQPIAQLKSTARALPDTDEDSAAENELLEMANQSRALAGAPPLRMEESLREAARAHARRMVSSQLLEHQLSGESSLLERIAQVSLLRLDRVGENIAYASCASGVNEVLMRSTPHRQNLLDPGFNVAGFAAIRSHNRLYVVQDFAHETSSYSAKQSEQLVSRSIHEIRQEAALKELIQVTPPNLDQAACSLAGESHPNARLLATAYDNRKIVAYTQSNPEVLPPSALHLLRDPGIRQFAVGACYARNAAYPTGMYWIAILLY